MNHFNLIIIFNNCSWPSKNQKLEELKKWFLSKINLNILALDTEYENIPFVNYGQMEKDGIEPLWFDMYVSSLIQNPSTFIPFKPNAIMFVLNTKQWQGKSARGWRVIGNDGLIKMQIAADENESLFINNVNVGSTFFNYARHELLHALFSYTGQIDTTHYWWDRWQLENALAEIDFGFKNSFLIKQLYNIIRAFSVLITQLTQQVEELKSEKRKLEEKLKSSRLVDWAKAIQQVEGWYVGSRSYRNNNPGNLKSSKYATGQDKQGFCVFPNYQIGFNALLYQLQLATHIAPDGKTSKYYNPEMTLWKFCQLYAPRTDGNDPDAYSLKVSQILEVSEEIQIKELT